MRLRPTGRTAITAVVVAWALACSAGFLVLLNYKAEPGDPGVWTEGWPAASRLKLDPVRPTLVLFAHPRCPCLRATLEELARILARCPDRAAVSAIFSRPVGLPVGWEQTDLWRTAVALPGVEVSCDEGGAEAGRFGVLTSGQILLYAPNGRLLFRGGITSSRGHAGDSEASRALLAFLLGEATERVETPVFGCPLAFPCPACAEKGEP